MSSHVNYTVLTNTTNEKYSYTQSSVVRRYNDFLWLHDILTDEYPYAVIPPMPEKNTMNRFEIEFVEVRRAALQAFLREIAASPLLKDSKRLRTFLTEDDEKFAEEKAETKSSLKDSLKGNPMEAGMKLLKMMGSGLNKVGSQVQKSVQQQMGGEAPMSKEDEKLAKYVQYISDLSEQVSALAAHAQDFVDNQSDFTANLIDMGLAMNLMGQLQQDVVGDAMRSLNDAVNVIQQVWTEKGLREDRAFVQPMKRLVLLLNEVKMTVGRRTLILSNYQSACHSLKKAKATYKKLASTPGKSSKLPGAEEEIERYKKRAGKLKKKLHTVTEKINGVLEDFRDHKMALIRNMVLDLLMIQMQYHKQVANVWRNYLPELQKINLEEAVKSAEEFGLASVDENRPRNTVADSSDDDDDDDSDESGSDSDSDSDSDEKPKKKAKKPAKKSKKDSSDESDSDESDSDDDSDDDDSDDDDSDDDSDDSDDSDDDSDSDDSDDSDSDAKPKKGKKSAKGKKPAKGKKASKKSKKDSSDDSDSD